MLWYLKKIKCGESGQYGLTCTVAAGSMAGGGEPGPAEDPRGDGTTSGGGSATQGAATWEERLDLSSRLQKICGE